jgi:CubicO group peptidase (beta-lactamase class C family)
MPGTRVLAKSLPILALLVHAGALGAQTPGRAKPDPASREKERLARFEKRAEELRERLKIPGLSAAIVRDQKVLWSHGFGFADLENRTPATPETLYHVASLSKTFASTLLLQLVEQGKLDLNEPMSRFSSDFKDDSVKVRHVLSHTSIGTPGEKYQYDGNRFDHLTAVIEKKTGKPYRQVMVETFLDPLAMAGSVPGHGVVDEADKWGALLGKPNLDRYTRNLSRLAQPYTLYGDGEVVHVPYPNKIFGASAGVLSTVLDLARYDAALARHRFLKQETQEKAWTAFTANGGQRLPYGFGWFVTDLSGVRLIWHHGNWGTGFSALYLKVPEKNLSLVLLANSEALADHSFQLSQDISDNVFACTFLRLFVSEDLQCERNSQTALAKWRDQRRERARKSIQVDPKVLEAYVGQYQYEDPPNRIFTVSREGARLFADIPQDFRAELFAESESEFFLKSSARQLVFIKEEGQVTRVELTNEWKRVSRAKRIKPGSPPAPPG